MINASDSINPVPNARVQDYATTLTATELRAKLEDVLAFDMNFQDSFIPSEEGMAIRIVSPTQAHADFVLTVVPQDGINHVCFDFDEKDTEAANHLLCRIGDKVALRSKTWLTLKHKALPPCHAGSLAKFLREFRDEPFADFIEMTGTAIKSGMECTRWNAHDLLMDELFFLSEIRRQLEERDEEFEANRERIRLALRKHENQQSVYFEQELIQIPHRHDIFDPESGLILRIHFAEDKYSCRIIIGKVEEITRAY
jgi:hypothetical protein